MKIGILECGHTIPDVVQEHGPLPTLFKRLLSDQGFEFAVYNIVDMQFPSSVEACDGWLLTGSRHGVYETHDFIPPLEEFVRAAFAAGRPMVGICFGHQIIAQAFGGHVEKFSNGWSLGLTDYEFDALGPIRLNAWHQDQVIEAPQGATTIARNDFCQHAALLYGNKALTIQAHPEFNQDIMSSYVSARKGTADYPDALMDQVMERRALPDDNTRIADMMGAFFHQAWGAQNV
ncbi:MAG: type 1 glutamine amidotransferase [Pseudomonadota bacterium]